MKQNKEKKKEVIEYCSKCGKLLTHIILEGHFNPYTGKPLMVKQCPNATYRVSHRNGSEYHRVDDEILAEEQRHDRYLPKYYDYNPT